MSALVFTIGLIVKVKCFYLARRLPLFESPYEICNYLSGNNWIGLMELKQS